MAASEPGAGSREGEVEDMVGELGVRARSYFRTDFWGAAAGCAEMCGVRRKVQESEKSD